MLRPLNWGILSPQENTYGGINRVSTKGNQIIYKSIRTSKCVKFGEAWNKNKNNNIFEWCSTSDTKLWRAFKAEPLSYKVYNISDPIRPAKYEKKIIIKPGKCKKFTELLNWFIFS